MDQTLGAYFGATGPFQLTGCRLQLCDPYFKPHMCLTLYPTLVSESETHLNIPWSQCVWISDFLYTVYKIVAFVTIIFTVQVSYSSACVYIIRDCKLHEVLWFSFNYNIDIVNHDHCLLFLFDFKHVTDFWITVTMTNTRACSEWRKAALQLIHSWLSVSSTNCTFVQLLYVHKIYKLLHDLHTQEESDQVSAKTENSVIPMTA